MNTPALKLLVDNGHGVGTPGKRSPDGRLREYAYSREIARRLVADPRLSALTPSLVVPEAGDITLSERVSRVNAWCRRLGASNVMLVSVHLNAAGCGGWMGARGWEAWTSPGQTGSDLLAESLYGAARRLLPPEMPVRCDRSDGDSDKEARFTILAHTACAAVLTENGFQDNRADAAWLLSDEGRRIITEIHVGGILDAVDKWGRGGE